MPFLLRKVKQERWHFEPATPLPAEPLTDLNAIANELSVWALEDNLGNLDEIVVGIAANSESLSKVDVAWIQEELIARLGLSVVSSVGITVFTPALQLHRDIIELKAENLLHIASAIRGNATYKLFTRPTVRSLLLREVKSGRLAITDLKPRVQDELRKYL